MEHKCSAIILRVIDYGEADRLVTFFSEEGGRLKGVAKNAKKSFRRFGGGLDPGTIGTVRYIEKPNVELVRLEEINTELPAWRVAKSLQRIAAFDVSLEIADKTLPLAQAAAERFGLLRRWIGFLADNQPSKGHCRAFYYKWLAASGLAPVFDKCVVCGKIKSSVWHLSPSHGGIVCSGCRHFHGDRIVSSNAVKYLQGFKAGKVSNGGVEDIDWVFELLLEHAIGSKLKSLEIAKKIV